MPATNTIAITACTPCYLTEEEQGWNVTGTANGVDFSASVDDAGNAIGDSADCWLSCRYSDALGDKWTGFDLRTLCDDILAAIDTAIAMSAVEPDDEV